MSSIVVPIKYHCRILQQMAICSLQNLKLLSKPQVDPNVRLDGQVFIVTGGNRGIGKGAVEILAKHGARVIIATFELEEAKKVASEHPQSQIDVQYLDLSSFKSIRSFVEHIIANEVRIDCLINNAAVMEASYKQTEDGIERAKQVNFLGPLLLTCLLLPTLEKCQGRVVNVASFGHMDILDMKLDDKNWWSDEEKYSGIRSYKVSKLGVLLMTRYMSNKLSSRGIKVYAADPGISRSKIIDPLIKSKFERAFIDSLNPFARTPEDAAVSLILAAVDTGGEYIPGQRYQMLYGKWIDPSPLAMDDKNAQAMWLHASALIGVEPKTI